MGKKLIKNEEDLDSAIRMYLEVDHEITQIETEAGAKIFKVQQDISDLAEARDKKTKGRKDQMKTLKEAIDKYVKDNGIRKMDLPSGKVATKASSKLVCDDEKATVELLRAFGMENLIRKVETVDKEGMKQLNEDTLLKLKAHIEKSINVSIKPIGE